MKTYFKIKYLFDKKEVHHNISQRLKQPGSDYICVADGVILNTANRIPDYLKVINGGMFSICDSGFVPLYIRWIYGERYEQYSGSQIFRDIVKSRKYRMIFLGTQQKTLDGLKAQLSKMNPDVESMKFVELPFRNVTDFDYTGIAEMITRDGADVIWVALGAPKQEYFMNYLKPHLAHGVMLGVGAAFKFYSGTDVARAPEWMVSHHMEFIHRIWKEPKKQIHRCFDILRTLPWLLYREWKSKSKNNSVDHIL